MSADAVLTCAGLRKRFGDRLAVDGVGFAVAEGETYGLLGPNGAGKTTTISMIAGLLELDAGDVRVAGRAVSTTPEGVEGFDNRRVAAAKARDPKAAGHAGAVCCGPRSSSNSSPDRTASARFPIVELLGPWVRPTLSCRELAWASEEAAGYGGTP